MVGGELVRGRGRGSESLKAEVQYCSDPRKRTGKNSRGALKSRTAKGVEKKAEILAPCGKSSSLYWVGGGRGKFSE